MRLTGEGRITRRASKRAELEMPGATFYSLDDDRQDFDDALSRSAMA